MRIAFSFEEDEIRKTVRAFTKKELLPLARQIDETGRMPESTEKRFMEMMLLTAAIPCASDESPGSFTGLIIALTELSYASMVPAWMLFENFLLAFPLYRFGADHLKREYLDDLVSLRKVGALAFTEAETGSDPAQIMTVAKKHENGWIINGAKRFITYSGICDYMILFAGTESGMGAFLIDAHRKGYTIGKREQFIHETAIDNGEIYLTDYFCPGDHLIGDVGQGFDILLETEAIGKVAFSAFFVGLAKRAIDLSIDFSSTRLHRGKPIGQKFQMLQGKISTMYAYYRAMEALLYQVSSKADSGADIIGDSAVLKLVVARNVRKITALAMEIHGAYGLSTEYEIERLYRAAISAQAVMGSMDIQQVIVSRHVMSMPAHRR